MESLRKSLPKADVRLNIATPEQRAEHLKRLHAINQLKSHSAPLGHGALQK
jgi:hypothetical protein